MPDLRDVERASIRAFVQNAADQGYLTGKVLDYGAGQQPYRDIVEAAGATYFPYDRPEFGGSVVAEPVGSVDHFGYHRYADAILCNQVLQYVPLEDLIGDADRVGRIGLLGVLRTLLRPGKGHLVMTGPTNWPEVEQEDLHRLTQAGIRRVLTDAGFDVVSVAPRAYYPGTELSLGWGAIARA